MDRPPQISGETIPYDVGVPELVGRIRPPGPVAWAACIALGHAGTPESLTILLDLLTDSDWCYRRIALQSLSVHALARSAAPQILACLSDPSPWVVRTACRTIGQLRLAEAHDIVRGLLACSDGTVREMAVFALSSIWQPTDFNLVLELFHTDHSKAVRGEAAECLTANVSEDNWRGLVAIWLRDSLPRHRVWACQCIARFGDAADRQWLLPSLADPDGHVRKAAKRAYDAMPP